MIVIVLLYLCKDRPSNLSSDELDTLQTGHLFLGYYDPLRKPHGRLWLGALMGHIVPTLTYKVKVSHVGVIKREDDGTLMLASLDNGYPHVEGMPNHSGVHYVPLQNYLDLFTNVSFVKHGEITNKDFDERFARLQDKTLEKDNGAMVDRWISQIDPNWRTNYDYYTCSEWISEFQGEYKPNIRPDEYYSE